MKTLTNKDYEKIADALLRKGFTVETVYAALESANFKVKFEGELHKVYASRILAIMHSWEDQQEVIDLD